MRLQNLRRAIVSFVWVVLAFAIYTVCVVPLVEPRRIDESFEVEDESLAVKSTDRYVRELQSLFPEGAWELQDPKVLRSEQVTVVFKDYEVDKEGRLILDKCSIVFYGDRNQPAERGPTVMQAPKGAILVFDGPLDLNSINGIRGRPVSGKLVGPITIFSAGIEGKSEDLSIATSNIEISEKVVWTVDPVQFRFGSTYGSGRYLLLNRIDTRDDGHEKDDWLAGLGIVELRHLDKLTIQVGDELFSSFSNVSGKATRGDPNSPQSIVDVACDGPLRLDLRQLIATLDDNVRVSRQQAGQRPDTISAQAIAIHLSRPKTTSTPADSANQVKVSKKRPPVAVSRVIATGDPVEINAPTEGAYVVCKRLEYNFDTGQIQLSGLHPFATPPAGRSAQRVIFRNQEHHVEAPTIDIVEGSDALSWQMIANGPGTYQGRPTVDVVAQASWSKQLSLQPVNGQQVLNIVGNAVVDAEGVGSVKSEQISVWLESRTQLVVSPVNGQRIAEQKLIPTHVVAKGSKQAPTKIESPQFYGSLESLTVVLTSAEPGRPTSGLGEARPVPDDSLRPQGGETKPIESRYHIDGGQVTLWVDPNQPGTREKLQRVQVNGQTEVREEFLVAGFGKEPLEVSGSRIDYRQSDTGVPSVELAGQPAVFQTSGMRLRGDSIQVQGDQNVVSIPGKGWMRLLVPKDGMSEQLGAEAAGRGETMPVEISWSGRLQFDGQTVNVVEDVVVSGTELNFQADHLTADLEERVELAQIQDRDRKFQPKLATLYAKGNVLAAARSLDERNQTKSVQQISTNDLHIDYRNGRTGELLGNGPGWVSVTSYGNSMSLAGRAQGSTPPDAASNRLSQMSLSFGQKLTGNLGRRDAHFEGGVHSWFGPVESWQARVDPLRVSKLGDEDATMTCDELFVLESPTAAQLKHRKPLELIARGNAQVQSQDYLANGHQIKFAEDKSLLTLEGDQTRPAELWQRNPGGRPSHSARVRRIRYWIDSQSAEVDALGVDISGKPTLQR